MARKSVLQQYNMLDGQTVNMSSNITSNITNVEQFDKCSLHLTWTAGPVGSFTVQARNGGKPAANTALPSPKIDDSWYDLDFGSAMSVTGADSELIIQLLELPFTDIRVKWAASSGSASDLKILLTQKVVGA